MSLSALSVRRPVFAWMLMFALILFGGISFLRMGVSQLPDVDFPVLTIHLTLPGAAPEIMETDVVDVVENAVMTIQGVRRVSSTSRTGAASVTVELELSRNIDLALQDAQAKVVEAQRRLPRELEPAVITKTNPDDHPILWLALQSDRHTLKELMEYVRDYLFPQFSTTPDVGDINLGGYVDPALRVWVDPEALSRYHLAVNDVVAAIQNEHAEPPAGWIAVGDKEYNVRTLGEAATIEEFSKLVINTRGGQPNFSPLRLDEVARIEDGLADIRRMSRAMGKPAVGLGIRKQRGSNAVAVAKRVREKLERVRKDLPQGMSLNVNFDSTRFIEEAVEELNFTLLLSALLTGLVCWLFLGSWSSTFNVLMAIPTSIVGTFIVLYFSGFTLNTFTLLGLSLAIGIVVDDAIMVLENIIRHREMGKGREQAALEGSQEITFAALAATLSIVAIFLPVAFMEGAIGRFFFQFGVTMTVAVLLSLLEALTLTPMRAAQFVETSERTTRIGKMIEKAIAWCASGYRRTLAIALARRGWVLASSLVFFGLSLFAVKSLNKEMLPPEDQSRFMVRIQTPVGSSLEATDEKLKQIESFLAARPEVDRYFGAIGGFGGGEVNTAVIFVTLKPKGSRGIAPELGHEPSQHDLMALFRKRFNQIAGLRATIQDLSMRGFSASRGFPVEFTVQGPEWDKLGEYSAKMVNAMEATGLMTDVDSNYLVGMPEIQVVPDRKKAAQHGVSVSAIGQTINALIGGVVVGKYSKGGHRYDIRLKIQENDKDRVAKISDLLVRNNRGELIRLSEVATVREKPTLLSIVRKDRERAVSVYANVATGKSQEAALEAVQRLGKEILGEGYRLVLAGGSEDFRRSFSQLRFALLLGLVVAYMILASQFNSFIDPFSVLLALPFSISGAFIALLATGQSLNIYSFIGLVLLMGIVKKNSILLVDFTNQVRERGETNPTRTLLTACPTRLRPILMTSVATIVGAIPAALAFGPGGESRVPMAIAVIGGVSVSTLLTLYVVPCAYSVLTRIERKRLKTQSLAA